MKPNYNHKYYLNIAETVFRIELSDQLYLFDHWCLFFQTFLKNFLSLPKKHHYVVRLTGPISLNRKMSPENPKIDLPTYRGNTCYFNNLLHPNLFLYSLRILLAKDLLKQGKLLLHASSFRSTNGCAVLIVGQPGDGKSTTLRKLVPPLLPLSDDMVVLTKKKGGVVAFPSPFNTKQDLSHTPNRPYPIAGIIFPVKRSSLSLTKADRAKSLFILLDQVFLPLKTTKDVQLALDTLRPISDKSYFLAHNLKDDILDLIEKNFKK